MKRRTRTITDSDKTLGRRILFAVLVVTVFFSLATAIHATGYSTDLASHTTLYTDIITGKSGGIVQINDDLGVGTASPLTGIESYGTDAGIIVHYTGNSRGGLWALSGQRVALATTGSTDDVVFGYGGIPVTSAGFVELMRLDSSNGNVGIGTSSPTTKLHIESGEATITTYDTDAAISAARPAWVFGSNGALFQIKSSPDYVSSSPRFTIDASGNIGIGTTAPTKKLDVIGDIQASGTICANGGADCVGGAASSAVPAGSIMMYGGSSAPSGWLLADGASYSTATYPDLFAAIGYTYGGSGSTFNVPDLRQRFPLGKAASGTGSTLGGTGGAIDHTHTGPSHTHGAGSYSHSHTHSISSSWGTSQTYSNNHVHGGIVAGGTTSYGDSVGHTHLEKVANSPSGSASSSSIGGTSGSGGTGNTGTSNPPYVVVNYIIKI